MTDSLFFGHMHEDHTNELSRVAHLPVNRALVIASGGDLAFALAGAEMHVLAVDSNPAQIDLVKRKMVDPGDAVGLCFGGRVDRMLNIAGPFIAWLMDWPRLEPGRLRICLTNTMETFLGLAVTLIHGRAAGNKVDRAALRLLRTRFEQALRDPQAATNPFLQVLLGKGFGSSVPAVWSAGGIAQWKTALDRIELRSADLAEVLAGTPPASFGLISVSNLPDTLDDTAWNALVMQAAAALKQGGYLVARSMLRQTLPTHPDGLFLSDPILGRDASPLCPVIWVGKRTEVPVGGCA